MKGKIISITTILILLIVIIVFFQIKLPMCYNILEKEPPLTFITYDETIVAQVKEEIKERPFYYIRISGHSMQPGIKHDDMCICTPESSYDKGDIVSFYIPIENNQVELIVHRIDDKDNNSFLTKGDANDIQDSWVVSENQIFCKVPEKTLFDKFKFAIMESEGRFSIFSMLG